MKGALSILTAIVVLTTAFRSVAADWYVDQTNGNDNNSGSTLSAAKKTFSAAQNAAQSGDTVWIVGELKLTGVVSANKSDVLIAGYGDDAVINAQDNCRAVEISNGAVVSNLTIRGGASGASSGTWSYPASGVLVNGGTLTHCEVTGCHPNATDTHCSAVQLAGTDSKVAYCDIHDNDSGKLSTSYAAGVDLVSASAKLLNSKIHHNRGRAAAVFCEHGLVESCEIYCNTNYPASELSGGATAGSGAGIRADSTTSRISKCRVYDNYGYGYSGGLWLRDGSIVENCLIYNNYSANYGAAIYCNSGNAEIRFCNIGGNVSGANEGNAIYVNGGTPVFKDNIIYGNGTDAAKEIKLENTSAPVTYCLLGASRSGNGNIAATKSPYVNAAGGNYLTADDSEGIDKGQDISSVKDDLNGRARPLDGGTGTAVSDIGCIEYFDQSALRSSVVYMNPQGSNERPYDTPEKGAHDLAAAVSAVDFVTLGHGEVRIAAGVYDCDNAEVSLPQAIWLLGEGREVTTLKKLRLELNHASAMVRGLAFEENTTNGTMIVKVTQGMVTNCIVRGFRYEIMKDQDFAGGAVVMSGSDTAPKVCRVVDSVISNNIVTLHKDRPVVQYRYVVIGAGVAFRDAYAVLQNCLVTDCHAAGNGGGIAIATGGGKIIGCEVTRCRASIRDDQDDAKYTVQGGGIYLLGGLSVYSSIVDCNVHHNYSNGSGAGIYVGNNCEFKILRTRITDNEVYAYAGSGLRIESTVAGSSSFAQSASNCLIARNHKRKNTGGAPGVYLKGGKLVNCTVTSNTGGEVNAGVTVYARTEQDADKYMSAVYNTIVWGNVTSAGSADAVDMVAGVGNLYANIVVPEKDGIEGTRIINSDPKLAADYTLRGGSSAIGSGSNELYITEHFGTVDLNGNDRFGKHNRLDIGCYERNARLGVVILYR